MKPNLAILDQRMRQDRRKQSDAYIQSRLNARSGTDRRNPNQVQSDNAAVARWMNTYSTIRAAI